MLLGISFPGFVSGKLIFGIDYPKETEAGQENQIAQLVKKNDVGRVPSRCQSLAWKVLNDLSQCDRDLKFKFQ